MEIRSIGNSAAPQPQVLEKAAASIAPKPAVAVPAPEVAAPAPGSTQLAQAVGHLNQTMKTRDSGLEFSIDEDSHRTVVKVVDQKTKELIRQMPSAEALEISKALDRVQGLLINQKA
jgi:flagellar protein FlaG